MSRIKFSNHVYLGQHELNRNRKFLDDDGFRKYIVENSTTFGLVNNQFWEDGELKNHFRNARVDNAGLDIGDNPIIEIRPIFAIDNEGLFVRTHSILEFQVPISDTWRWVKIRHRYSHAEDGTFSVDEAGNLSGTGGSLTNVLRGQPDFPSRIRFKDADLNTLEYEVADVIDDNNATLVGDFQNESDLKVIVVGTFTGDYVPTSNEKDIFQYDNCEISFHEEPDLNSPPSKQDGKEFWIARIRGNESGVEVQDMREEWHHTIANHKHIQQMQSGSAIVGFEYEKFTSRSTTQDWNKVGIGFGYRIESYTYNTSLRQITIQSGSGGKFQGNPSEIGNGTLDGYRLYVLDSNVRNQYYTIRTGIVDGSNYILTLDRLIDQNFDGSEQLVICPQADFIEVELNNPFPVMNESRMFHISSGAGEILVSINFPEKIGGQNYQGRYRFITGANTTEWFDVGSGVYRRASHFDDDGNLIDPAPNFSSYIESTIFISRAPNRRHSRYTKVLTKSDTVAGYVMQSTDDVLLSKSDEGAIIRFNSSSGQYPNGKTYYIVNQNDGPDPRTISLQNFDNNTGHIIGPKQMAILIVDNQVPQSLFGSATPPFWVTVVDINVIVPS